MNNYLIAVYNSISISYLKWCDTTNYMLLYVLTLFFSFTSHLEVIHSYWQLKVLTLPAPSVGQTLN